MTKEKQPIAVMDSGIGGISVLKELVRCMPHEQFIYYGDYDNAPYGTKTAEHVRQLVFQNVEKLMEYSVKGLVIACNTATGVAVRPLREAYPTLPVIGIEPAIKPAVSACENPTVLVMATPLTLQEEKFEMLLKRATVPGATIIRLPCAGLMEIIESGCTEGEEIDAYLEKLFCDIPKSEITGVVLGCTHYPHAKKSICAALGGNIPVYDGGFGTAKETKRRLQTQNLLAPTNQTGGVLFLNTEHHAEKIALAKRLLEANTDA